MTHRTRIRPRQIVRNAGERHGLPLGLAILGIVAFLTWIAYTSVNTAPFSSPFQLRAVIPADAPILVTGDEVRIAGIRVGDVVGIAPATNGRLVTFDVDHGPVRQSATLTVRQQGLSGAVYRELSPGTRGRALRQGATIPLSRASTNVDLATIATAFGDSVR